MEINSRNYILLILGHFVLGFLIFLIPFLSSIYAIVMILFGLYVVIKNKNANNEVLYICAYITGAEVFLRMTNGSLVYEFGKYGVLCFSIIGILYSGISKRAAPFWFYLALLIPSILIGAFAISSEYNFRKALIFNLLGAVTLGFSALYCCQKKVTITNINNLLLIIGLPIVSCLTYIYFFTPVIKDVLVGTGSNSKLSGGFGPNQVATILGLGVFIYFSRLLLTSLGKIVLLINLAIIAYATYRGILTFSRGGMITGFAMIIVLTGYIFFISKAKNKIILSSVMLFLTFGMAFVWLLLSSMTNGLIDKRYTNRDKFGVEKRDVLTGRGKLAEIEIDMFLDNPIFGAGVGIGTQIRYQKLNEQSASHDEITRILGEHGTLGIVALLILFITPILYFTDNKQHIYMLPFLAFWLFTINHAAMRTVAPAFIYGLTLLKVRL